MGMNKVPREGAREGGAFLLEEGQEGDGSGLQLDPGSCHVPPSHCNSPLVCRTRTLAESQLQQRLHT